MVTPRRWTINRSLDLRDNQNAIQTDWMAFPFLVFDRKWPAYSDVIRIP
jgi:hypothetical protein